MFDTLKSAVQGLGYREFYLYQSKPGLGAIVSVGTALDSGARAVYDVFEGARRSLYLGNSGQGRQYLSEAKEYAVVCGNSLLNVCSLGFLNCSLVGQGLLLPPPVGPAREEGFSSANVQPTIQFDDAKGEKVQGTLALPPGKHDMTLLHDTFNSFAKGATIELETKGPIYHFKKAEFAGMEKSLPCLLMRVEDFRMIQERIHPGAFGKDYWVWEEKALMVVWKFPADLLHISGYQGSSSPNSVGTYPLQDDAFNEDKTGFGLVQQSAEKMRIDYKTGDEVVSIHYFKMFPQNEVIPGISTGNFFQNFNRATDKEYTKVETMLATLKECGIVAFPCNMNHHAVVLYAQKIGDAYTLMTPQLFAQLLQDDKRIFTAVQEAANQDMQPWKEAFVKSFLSDTRTED